jgi:hypothetical protein
METLRLSDRRSSLGERGKLMDEDGPVESAVEAIRCLYLARKLRCAGQEDAAERWEARATEWSRGLEANPLNPLDDSRDRPGSNVQ